MTQLIVKTGTENHLFQLPVTASKDFKEFWSPSDFSLDVRVFARREERGWRCYVRPSNDSIVPGHKERTKPMISVSGISVEFDGNEMIAPFRNFPTIYPMGRGSWREIRIGDVGPLQFVDGWRQRSQTYGPCDLPLPVFSGDLRKKHIQQDSAMLRYVYNQLWANQPFRVDDTYDAVLFPIQGWMPHGPTDPGDVGGTGIYFFTGYRQNAADLRLAELLSQCEGDRAKTWVDRVTGEPIGTEHYAGETPDVWAMKVPPEAYNVPNNGGDFLPQEYDFAHKIRGFRRTAQIAEQADHPMAKWMLRADVATERLRFSHRGRKAVPGYVPGTLRVLKDAGNIPEGTIEQGLLYGPHTGIYGSLCGRQYGWWLFELAWSVKLSGFHGEERAILEAAYDAFEKLTTPEGPMQKVVGGSGWPSTPVQKMQTFEQVILSYGLLAAANVLDRPAPIFVHRIAENVYGPNSQLPILPYGGSSMGPPHYVRSAEDNGKPVMRLKDAASNYGDPAHALSMLALAASIDPNPKTWVERGALYGTPFPNWEAKLAWLTSTQAPDNLTGDAGWIAAAQRLAHQP